MRKLGAILIALVVAAPVWAAGPKLQIICRAEHEVRRVDAQGKERVVLEPVTATYPGETLVYTLEYQNTGDAPAVSPIVGTPVPKGTVLVRGTLVSPGGDVRYSLDGKTWSEWPRVRAAGVAGDAEIDAPAEAVRHLRVTLREPVPAGGRGRAQFKVIVQ
jgi:uncharacterized repeat protein (TIGR01451 family)